MVVKSGGEPGILHPFSQALEDVQTCLDKSLLPQVAPC